MSKFDMTATARILSKILQEKGLSKIELSERANIKQSTTFSILSGKTNDVKVSNLVKISEALNIPLEQLLGLKQQKVIALDDNDLPTTDYVQIPQYQVSFGCGESEEPTYEELTSIRPATYHLSYFQKLGVNPKNCIRLLADGDSMSPLINDGDYVLVDKNQTDIKDGKIYAFIHDHSLRIKRLRRMNIKQIALISENSENEKEIVSLDGSVFFKIIGKVIERSGSLP